jgi:hypothetical protein
MKDKAQLLESIERFRQGFWAKKTIDRPPVGIAPSEIYMPIKYLRKKLSSKELQPQDINADLYLSDYEFAFASKSVQSDDFIPFATPWRAVPWLEAICGCPVHYAQGSMAAGHYVKCPSDLLEIKLPANLQWLTKLKQETQRLIDVIPPDCWISPTILRGPSDVLASMRGLTDFYCDLPDNLSVLHRAAAKVNQVLLDVLDMHFTLVAPKMNGYGHIYGYWAPDKTIVIQEDVLGMCSPALYRDVFRKYNAEIVEKFGHHVFFHLHSTGYQHYQDVLEIENIAGLQMTIEANGPSLREMTPFIKEILEHSRLILFLDYYFEQLPDVLKQVPREGLYFIISDKYIATEKHFLGFIKENF